VLNNPIEALIAEAPKYMWQPVSNYDGNNAVVIISDTGYVTLSHPKIYGGVFPPYFTHFHYIYTPDNDILSKLLEVVKVQKEALQKIYNFSEHNDVIKAPEIHNTAGQALARINAIATGGQPHDGK